MLKSVFLYSLFFLQVDFNAMRLTYNNNENKLTLFFKGREVIEVFSCLT